jgi:hypothetical protein
LAELNQFSKTYIEDHLISTATSSKFSVWLVQLVFFLFIIFSFIYLIWVTYFYSHTLRFLYCHSNKHQHNSFPFSGWIKVSIHRGWLISLLDWNDSIKIDVFMIIIIGKRWLSQPLFYWHHQMVTPGMI